MTYEATVEFKFDSTWTPTYASSIDDDFIPEEHFVITAPAADLNCRQYFKLFEKFMLGVGMSPHNIREGAMSLVLNELVNDADQRKICDEYEVTRNEDLPEKFREWKKLNKAIESFRNSKQKMTKYKQKLYDVIADWWDEMFSNTAGIKDIGISTLVDRIMELDTQEKSDDCL